MTRTIILAVCLLLLGTSATGLTYNDDDEVDSYIIAVGISEPVGPSLFNTNWKTGFNFMAGFGFAVSPSVDIISKFEYHRFGFKTGKYRADPLSLYMFGIDMRPMALTRGTGRMFLVGGLGFCRTETPDVIDGLQLVWASDVQMNLYINFGGGLEFKMAKDLWVYMQLRFVDIAAVDYFNVGDLTFYPFTLGVRF